MWDNHSMTKAKHLIFFLAISTVLSGCSVFYVVKQGVFQLELIAGAESIETALRKPTLDHSQRKKLELILDVRRFAEQTLKLNVHKNYKDINLSWHRSIHTITASSPIMFKPYLWWFPVIGSVPYKGFFSERDADLERKRLEASGYETQKREISGYSTLGYFADPVWPAMLDMADFALAELIIHELAHATVYLPNQTSFNETFANFVGKVGARAYVVNRFGENSTIVQKMDAYRKNGKAYQEFFQNLYSRLDELYGKSISDEEKLQQKQIMLNDARVEYESLVSQGAMFKIDFSEINNAYLLSFKSYHDNSDVFAKLFSLVGSDFGAFIEEVNFYARSSAPFASLGERAQRLEKKL